LIARAENREEALFVPLGVTLELEWVLRSRFRFSKKKVLETFTLLLETRELEIHEEAAVEHALYLYRQHSADFAECLHVGCALARGAQPLMTFDVSAAKLPGAQLLK
jgi:predicted nucleic-acid-binding protein